MVVIRRAAGNTSDSRPAAGILKQARPARPGTVDAAAIARKTRAIATALQNLHGI
jgi:hypothetical protein